MCLIFSCVCLLCFSIIAINFLVNKGEYKALLRYRRTSSSHHHVIAMLPGFSSVRFAECSHCQYFWMADGWRETTASHLAPLYRRCIVLRVEWTHATRTHGENRCRWTNEWAIAPQLRCNCCSCSDGVISCAERWMIANQSI